MKKGDCARRGSGVVHSSPPAAALPLMRALVCSLKRGFAELTRTCGGGLGMRASFDNDFGFALPLRFGFEARVVRVAPLSPSSLSAEELPLLLLLLLPKSSSCVLMAGRLCGRVLVGCDPLLFAPAALRRGFETVLEAVELRDPCLVEDTTMPGIGARVFGFCSERLDPRDRDLRRCLTRGDAFCGWPFSAGMVQRSCLLEGENGERGGGWEGEKDGRGERERGERERGERDNVWVWVENGTPNKKQIEQASARRQ